MIILSFKKNLIYKSLTFILKTKENSNDIGKYMCMPIDFLKNDLFKNLSYSSYIVNFYDNFIIKKVLIYKSIKINK